jgi:5'-3' exonuclease
MNKKDFTSILDSIKNDVSSQHRNSRVLVVDSMNTFLRCFSIINVMNLNGHHVGGLTGFLKSVGYAIKLIRPTRVILVFDGIGGSDSRKNLYSEYKGNRNVKRVTNWEGFDTRDEESESMSAQMSRLINYLEELPVDMVVVDKVEADDVMAYVTHRLKSDDNHITIMSSDQDFLQLVSRNVSVYAPTKKKIYTPEKVKEEFGVSSYNFLIKKILMGDKSDNVPGVTGLGPKKLLKLFPELSGDEPVTLQEIYDKCVENQDDLLSSRIVNFKYQLNINTQLMDLHNPNIPQTDEFEIDEIIDGSTNRLNVGAFIKMCEEDSLQKAFPNVESWLNECFMGLNRYSKK